MDIEVINNVTRVTNKPKLNQAIGDTGTTGNFVLPGAPVDDVKVAENPIEIEMANGSISKSAHMCYLRIPGLPRELREAHIVPCLFPFCPNINQKSMQRSMCRYFQG